MNEEHGKGWEHFAHSQGAGIRAMGLTLDEAFELSGHALMAYVLENPESVRAEVSVDIFCESSDLDFLFSDWINSLIYEMNQRQMVFRGFKVHVEGINVTGKLWGDRFDPLLHHPKGALLGAGFTALQVEEQVEGFRVQCVLNEPKHTLLIRRGST